MSDVHVEITCSADVYGFDKLDQNDLEYVKRTAWNACADEREDLKMKFARLLLSEMEVRLKAKR